MNKADDYICAVFIDGENFGLGHDFGKVLNACREFGRIAFARLYADWAKCPSHLISIYESDIEPVFVPHISNNGSNKSITDVRIACDVLETIHHHPDVNVYILLTGDGDFIPAVEAIRRHGKWSVVIGLEGHTSSHLREKADIFLSYDDLVTESVGPDICKALADAAREAIEQGHIPNPGLLKNILIEKIEGFDEGNFRGPLGRFRSFKEFAEEVERRGFVKIVHENGKGDIIIPAKAKGP